MKAVHIGYDHRSDDIRIVRKECTSLAKNGIETVFITTQKDGCEDLSGENLKIIEIPGDGINYGKIRHFARYLLSGRKKYKAVLRKLVDTAAKEKPDVIHVHELKLLSTGLQIKGRTGAKIIYDIHEDYPRQRENEAIGRSAAYAFCNKILSLIVEINENRKAGKCDYLVCATDHISERFKRINPNTITITNYPVFESDCLPDYNEKSKDFCYIGTFNRARGIPQIVQAFQNVDAGLYLGGKIPEDLKGELQQIKGWDKVNVLGYISREKADSIMRNCLAGLLNFLPTGNNYYSVPNKLFEYLSNGIPVIASDFPTFREIIEKNKCGICVDPQNPESIRKAVQYILDHPEEGKLMGLRGFRAVKDKYNWAVEETKLIDIYERIK